MHAHDYRTVHHSRDIDKAERAGIDRLCVGDQDQIIEGVSEIRALLSAETTR